jgi:glycosyltransferase involved in cell wall biosynthesis
MRIVIDARELRTSSGRYVERLLKYLQSIDKENDYYVLLTTKDFEGWLPINPKFNKVVCDIKEFTFAEQIALRRLIKKLKPDLVHFTFPQQPVWYKGKTVTTIHDLTTLRFVNPSKNLFVFKFKQRVFKFVICKSVNKAEQVIVPTEFVKDDLIKLSGLNQDKISVTYESADPINEASETYTDLENIKYIMYIGRPTPHKNLNRLVDAFVLLKSKHPDLKLVLAGKKDFNYMRIEESINKCGIKDVIFTDFITDGQLKWLYENCSAYVFPSLSEGFGLPGLEAMQSGAPVVSSNASCLPEVYGDAAEYFDPLSVDDMNHSLEQVLTNEALRDELIQRGYDQVKKYSWEKMAKQTLEIYKKST